MTTSFAIAEPSAKVQCMVPAYEALAHAIETSRIRDLNGMPYPLSFRNQDGAAAWAKAMGRTQSWRFWADPGTSCHDLRTDMQWYIDNVCETLPSRQAVEYWRSATRFAAVESSVNLLYAIRKGMQIDVTPALDSLLLNSDVDRQLPLSMLAPPYPAQYIRFSSVLAREIKLPDFPNPEHVLDGVFCFLTPPSPGPNGYPSPRLELVFISTFEGRYFGHISLLGTIDDPGMSVMDWLSGILSRHAGAISAANRPGMNMALDYVAKVFLYLGLRQARIAHHGDYTEGMRRAERAGPKKRSRQTHRLLRRYDCIEVGPTQDLVADAVAVTNSPVAAHWRRGHFRLQACGEGWLERRMIYIAPVLVHADEVAGIPQPRDYRVG